MEKFLHVTKSHTWLPARVSLHAQVQERKQAIGLCLLQGHAAFQHRLSPSHMHTLCLNLVQGGGADGAPVRDTISTSLAEANRQVSPQLRVTTSLATRSNHCVSDHKATLCCAHVRKMMFQEGGTFVYLFAQLANDMAVTMWHDEEVKHAKYIHPAWYGISCVWLLLHNQEPAKQDQPTTTMSMSVRGW
jgi:hypothetical protein